MEVLSIPLRTVLVAVALTPTQVHPFNNRQCKTVLPIHPPVGANCISREMHQRLIIIICMAIMCKERRQLQPPIIITMMKTSQCVLRPLKPLNLSMVVRQLTGRKTETPRAEMVIPRLRLAPQGSTPSVERQPTFLPVRTSTTHAG